MLSKCELLVSYVELGNAKLPCIALAARVAQLDLIIPHILHTILDTLDSALGRL